MFAFCKSGFHESPLSSVPVPLISRGQVEAYQGQKGLYIWEASIHPLSTWEATQGQG